MAIIGFIVVGDRTSHGGVVISGDPAANVEGKLIARIGDKVSCPRCKRVSLIKTSRFPFMNYNGQLAAFDQDVTDCGAKLHSHHNGHAGWGSESGADPANKLASESLLFTKQPNFQEHFILQDNVTGKVMPNVPYTIRTGEGKEYEGVTDEQGRTEVVWTESPKAIEVIAHQQKPDKKNYHNSGGNEYEGM